MEDSTQLLDDLTGYQAYSQLIPNVLLYLLSYASDLIIQLLLQYFRFD